MQRIKLSRSSTITSKRFGRRAKFTAGQIRTIFRKIFPVLILVPVLYFLNGLFIIKKIDCSLNAQPCPEDTTKVVNRLLGTNSLFINQKELVTGIKAVYPIDTANVSLKMFNTLKIDLLGTRPFIQADVYLVKDLPVLSMDQAPSTTDSASWWTRPTMELQDYVNSKEPLGFDLWNNGSLTSIATTGVNLSYIFSAKPDANTIASVYQLVDLVSQYLSVPKIYIVNDRGFLSQTGGPDIIVNVPFDEVSLKQALQSLSYLATIKKDAKVIDLSFKNPIIR
jgi:hypothetical protein